MCTYGWYTFLSIWFVGNFVCRQNSCYKVKYYSGKSAAKLKIKCLKAEKGWEREDSESENNAARRTEKEGKSLTIEIYFDRDR